MSRYYDEDIAKEIAKNVIEFSNHPQKRQSEQFQTMRISGNLNHLKSTVMEQETQRLPDLKSLHAKQQY